MSGAVFDLPHHRRLYGQREDAAHTPASTLSASVQHTQDAAQTERNEADVMVQKHSKWLMWRVHHRDRWNRCYAKMQEIPTRTL